MTDQPTSPVTEASDATGPRGDPPTVSGERRAGLPVREGPARTRRRSSTATLTPGAAGGAVDMEVDAVALDLARRIVDLASDKKASDVVLLDLRSLTTVTDYFVICSGGSERQLEAIGDGIIEGLKESGVLPIGREGGANAHWTLVDYGFAVVHVMAEPEREYYALEKLWSDAPLLLRVM